MRVLVIGATGRLGGRLARTLLADGYTVRAASRTPQSLDDLRSLGAEVVHCDLRRPGTITAAVRGVDVVVHAAHALVPPDGDNRTADVDGAGVRELLEAAARSRTGHVVLSSLRGGRPDHPSEFFRHKAAAEEKLRASGVPHTILRMAAFMETYVLGLMGESLRSTGRVPVLGPGTQDRNFVSVDDAVAVARRRIAAPGPPTDATIEVVGPENLSELEAIARLEAALRRPARRRHLPLPVARALAAVTRVVRPSMSPLLAMAVHTAAHGDAADLTPRAGLVVGQRRLDDVIRSWVHDRAS